MAKTKGVEKEEGGEFPSRVSSRLRHKKARRFEEAKQEAGRDLGEGGSSAAALLSDALRRKILPWTEEDLIAVPVQAGEGLQFMEAWQAKVYELVKQGEDHIRRSHAAQLKLLVKALKKQVRKKERWVKEHPHLVEAPTKTPPSSPEQLEPQSQNSGITSPAKGSPEEGSTDEESEVKTGEESRQETTEEPLVGILALPFGAMLDGLQRSGIYPWSPVDGSTRKPLEMIMSAIRQGEKEATWQALWESWGGVPAEATGIRASTLVLSSIVVNRLGLPPIPMDMWEAYGRLQEEGPTRAGQIQATGRMVEEMLEDLAGLVPMFLQEQGSALPVGQELALEFESWIAAKDPVQLQCYRLTLAQYLLRWAHQIRAATEIVAASKGDSSWEAWVKLTFQAAYVDPIILFWDLQGECGVHKKPIGESAEEIWQAVAEIKRERLQPRQKLARLLVTEKKLVERLLLNQEVDPSLGHVGAMEGRLRIWAARVLGNEWKLGRGVSPGGPSAWLEQRSFLCNEELRATLQIQEVWFSKEELPQISVSERGRGLDHLPAPMSGRREGGSRILGDLQLDRAPPENQRNTAEDLRGRRVSWPPKGSPGTRQPVGRASGMDSRDTIGARAETPGQRESTQLVWDQSDSDPSDPAEVLAEQGSPRGAGPREETVSQKHRRLAKRALEFLGQPRAAVRPATPPSVMESGGRTWFALQRTSRLHALVQLGEKLEAWGERGANNNPEIRTWVKRAQQTSMQVNAANKESPAEKELTVRHWEHGTLSYVKWCHSNNAQIVKEFHEQIWEFGNRSQEKHEALEGDRKTPVWTTFISRFMREAKAVLFSYDEQSQLRILKREFKIAITGHSIASQTFETECRRRDGDRVFEEIIQAMDAQYNRMATTDWHSRFTTELDNLERPKQMTIYSFMGHIERLAELYGFDIQALESEGSRLFDSAREKVARSFWKAEQPAGWTPQEWQHKTWDELIQCATEGMLQAQEAREYQSKQPRKRPTGGGGVSKRGRDTGKEATVASVQKNGNPSWCSKCCSLDHDMASCTSDWRCKKCLQLGHLNRRGACSSEWQETVPNGLARYPPKGHKLWEDPETRKKKRQKWQQKKKDAAKKKKEGQPTEPSKE